MYIDKQVEGQNVLAVREATKFCADYIRAGNVRLWLHKLCSVYALSDFCDDW